VDSDPKCKVREEALKAGVIGGVRLNVQAQFPEGVSATTPVGDRRFMPLPFLDLLLLRKRGTLP